MYKQLENQAYEVPLHERLETIPHNARLIIEDENGLRTRYIPIGCEAKLAAAELRRLHVVEAAFREWITKTEWVQKTGKPHELGMHRADVLNQRIGCLHNVNQELVAVLENVLDCTHSRDMTDPSAYEKAQAALAKLREKNT